MENKKNKNEKKVVLENIFIVGDKAIISIDDEHHYLVDFNKFVKAKEKFFLSEEGKIIPYDPLILFDSYNVINDDGGVNFLMNCKVSGDSCYSIYSINGFLNKEGKVSNCFYVETPDDKYEIFISEERSQNGNTIVYECFEAIRNYYEPYFCTLEVVPSKTKVRYYS